jgi:hypothetical protein
MGFWQSTLRRRKKRHQCATCYRHVEAGEQSYDEAGIANGDFSSYRQCVPCHDLVTRLYTAGAFDGGWLLSDLREIAEGAGEPWPPHSNKDPHHDR